MDPAASGSSFWDVLLAPFGVAETAITTAGNTATTVFSGGQETVETVFVHGQDTLAGLGAEAGETVRDATDPWSLAGFGFGATLGGSLVFGGLVLGGAALADELFAGGAGRSLLFARLRGKRR